MNTACHLAYPITKAMTAPGLLPENQLCATTQGATAAVLWPTWWLLLGIMAIALLVGIVKNTVR